MALLCWLALAPPRNRLGFWLQVIAVAAVLWAMALLGIWLIPPWWVPYVLGAALAVAASAGWRRQRHVEGGLPATFATWVVTLLLAASALGAIYGVFIALRSRAPGPGPVVPLSFPLESGAYLVVNGGSNINTNAHLMALDASSPQLRAWRGPVLVGSPSFPVWAAGAGFLLVMAALVLRGIRESMWVNVAFTLVEATGLLLVIAVGIAYWGSVDLLEIPDVPGGDATAFS